MKAWFDRFEPPGGSRLLPMEGLRGFAVLLVFGVHFGGAVLGGGLGLDVENIPLQDLLGRWRKLLSWMFASHHGVYLFFILSGFLICRMVTSSKGFSYPKFMWGRILRIYPAFLVSLALSIAWFVYGPVQGKVEAEMLWANLLFLNAIPAWGFHAYNHVTWSLFMEFAFYLIFPILLLLRPLGMFREKWQVPAAGFFLVYGGNLYGYVNAAYLFFFAGAFIAQFENRDLRRFAQALPDGFVFAAFVFLTTGRAMKWFDYHGFVLLFNVTGTLLVIQACFGTGWLRRIFEWPALRWVGNISYSFYLVHSLMISVTVQWLWEGKLTALADKGNALLLLFASLLGTLLLASLMFLLFERPYFARKGHVAVALAGSGN
ncbi:hypothetical protein BURK2_03525 [Burkholderiales bacterium]|nr:hypothetical protein BURK2_03525 [Burkholderiales bacterium]